MPLPMPISQCKDFQMTKTALLLQTVVTATKDNADRRGRTDLELLEVKKFFKKDIKIRALKEYFPMVKTITKGELEFLIEK